MKESSEIKPINFKEYRQEVFKLLEEDTKIFSDDEYQEIYRPAKEYFGINSPAVIIPGRFFDKLPESVRSEAKGNFLIAINHDSVPDPDFIEYLKEHEYWELYIKNKKGINLKAAVGEDFKLPVLEKKRPAHRFAIVKELRAAEADGKLDEYIQWWRDFYQADVEHIKNMPDEEIEKISKNYGEQAGREAIIQRILKNLELKEEVYNKIKARKKIPGEEAA